MSTSGKKKKYRKKRLRAALNVFLLLAVLCGVVLSLTVFFKIETINIEGESDYTEQQVLSALGLEAGDNLFLFLRSARAARITRTLPYIEAAVITRTLPSTVTVTLTAAAKTACVQTEIGYAVVGRDMKVLDILSRPSGDAPLLLGVEAQTAAVGEKLEITAGTAGSSAFEIAQLLEAYGFIEKVGVIDVQNKLAVQFVYDGRILVSLGTVSDTEYKLRMFRELIDNRLSTDFAGYVDLTVAGEAVVGADELCVAEEYPDLF